MPRTTKPKKELYRYIRMDQAPTSHRRFITEHAAGVPMEDAAKVAGLSLATAQRVMKHPPARHHFNLVVADKRRKEDALNKQLAEHSTPVIVAGIKQLGRRVNSGAMQDADLIRLTFGLMDRDPKSNFKKTTRQENTTTHVHEIGSQLKGALERRNEAMLEIQGSDIYAGRKNVDANVVVSDYAKDNAEEQGADDFINP